MNKQTTQKPLAAIVIGCGYLGSFHAQKYALAENAQLVAIVDPNPAIAETLRNTHQCPVFQNIDDVNIDFTIASIATPSDNHFAIAKTLIRRGIHLLIEKPLCATLEHAHILCELAKKHNVIVQVGHQQRFNPVMQTLYTHLHTPLFIEFMRIAPFHNRGTEVDVIFDLMVHDIDLAMSIAKSPIVNIRANGLAVFTDSIDIANARLEFANGCCANITTSRSSQKKERKIRLFQSDNYISADLANHVFEISKKAASQQISTQKLAEYSTLEKDEILQEIRSFIHCVQTYTQPLVDAQQACHVIDVAQKIQKCIAQHAQNTVTNNP